VFLLRYRAPWGETSFLVNTLPEDSGTKVFLFKSVFYLYNGCYPEVCSVLTWPVRRLFFFAHSPQRWFFSCREPALVNYICSLIFPGRFSDPPPVTSSFRSSGIRCPGHTLFAPGQFLCFPCLATPFFFRCPASSSATHRTFCNRLQPPLPPRRLLFCFSTNSFRLRPGPLLCLFKKKFFFPL